MTLLRVGILISGNGSNMEAIIRGIKKRNTPAVPAIVISDNALAGGLKTAKELNVNTAIVQSGESEGRREYDGRIIRVLNEHGVMADGLVCLAGFMRIVGPRMLTEYRNRIINIHPSLLPAFPGRDAQKQAIMYGARVSGCTVHFADDGVDSGAIIGQSAVRIADGDTPKTLAERIRAREHVMYPEIVDLFAKKRIRVSGRNVSIWPK